MYESVAGGVGTMGGFGYHGLGATFDINHVTGDPGVRELQEELQRIGLLAPGTGPTGADGKWGPRTKTNWGLAARMSGWKGEAYEESCANRDCTRGTVTIPDDLFERVKSLPRLSPEQIASLRRGVTPPEEGGAVAPSPPVSPPIAPPPSEEEADKGWVPAAVLGGAVLLVGGLVWYWLREDSAVEEEEMTPVTANRRRRSRKRRKKRN